MGKIESYAPGSFCWAELATSDAAAAKRFYSEMFGWTRSMSRRRMALTRSLNPGRRCGGPEPGAAGSAGPLGVYFAVASADQTAAQVGPSGGKLIAGPFDVMDVGRMAVCQDPQGAIFSLWQAGRISARHTAVL